MNAWFDRYLAALDAAGAGMSRDEAREVLELAGAAARSAGARQFAPIATYLAGRLAAAGGTAEERVAVLVRAAAAAAAAGPATEPLGID